MHTFPNRTAHTVHHSLHLRYTLYFYFPKSLWMESTYQNCLPEYIFEMYPPCYAHSKGKILSVLCQKACKWKHLYQSKSFIQNDKTVWYTLYHNSIAKKRKFILNFCMFIQSGFSLNLQVKSVNVILMIQGSFSYKIIAVKT